MELIDRRDFLKAGMASAALGRAFAQPQTASPDGLRDLAAKKNLLVGSAVSYRELQDPAFTALLAQEASIAVPENEMKWAIIHPEPDRYDFERADALLAFTTQHHQKLRGHNLCWHEQLPKWFITDATPKNADSLLREHIETVAGHFAGHIQSWDVVNEAIHVEDSHPDGLRNSIWLQLLGPDYIAIAFRTAAQADPHALLTYNDYDIEQPGPKFDAKRKALLQLLRSMRQQNIPIQALGLQSHLRAGTKLPDWTPLHEFMAEVEKLDFQIFITELDVNDADLPSGIEERDALVAALYYDYLTNVLEHKSVKAVLTWGLTDRDTWLNHRRGNEAQRLERALPFDSALKPKLAYWSMWQAIAVAASRTNE